MFRITVHPGSALLERYRGTPTRVLGAGRHRRRRGAQYRPVDLREQLTALAVQEVPAADGLVVRASVALRWKVVDPVAFTEVADDPVAVLYLAAQIALRDLVARHDAEQLPAAVRAAAEELLAAVAGAGRRLGIETVAVDVKDVVLPVELRHARAELVTARHRAQVRLDEARAETAALRSLANGARLLADNPALAQLRLVQALPPGTTLELRTGLPSERDHGGAAAGISG